MKKYLLIAVICVLCASAVGCTDAFRADLGSYGHEHLVSMYNGGKLVRQWTSTGKVESMAESDGWQFMDKKTKKLIRVGGDVIIEVL